LLARIGEVSASWARRFIPHPFVFALLLTLVTFVTGIVVRGEGPLAMIEHWQGGFWDFLEFGMQMTLILVTGHALASSAPVRRAVTALAARAGTTARAAPLTALVAMAAGLVNWGLGLIVGAYLAREIGLAARREGRALHYPLVCAAGYMGLLVWHGGFSGSAPLTVSTAGHFLEAEMGRIPITQTLLSGLNLVVALLLLAGIPLLFVLLAPRGTAPRAPLPEPPAGEVRVTAQTEEPTPAARLEVARPFSWVFFLLALVFLVAHFRRRGFFGIDLNTVNFFFLFLGFLLHGSPRAYARAVDGAVRGAAGIILQFPFYAGIMGMMVGSGLVEDLAGAFVRLAETGVGAGVPADASLPVLTFLSAGLVNVFVPSGGGQWGVQGPVMVQAASNLGVDLPKVVLALSYGDEWTNMLQPFWALALLGITGLEARDIIGYTLVVMVLVLPMFVVPLILF
jgi:short-chain fatty acids transporter